MKVMEVSACQDPDLSFCADPLADGFNPTLPAPPELSPWLYLFHAYLQMEEVHRETLDWLNFIGALLKVSHARHQAL